jgi:hypothetical protein
MAGENGSAKMGKHPGFAALVKSGVPAAALAASTRKASKSARAKNPRLNRVAKKGQTKSAPKAAAKGGMGKGK